MSALSDFRQKLLQIWNNKDIRDKIWFSIMVIIVFRVLAAIPVPGLPLDALEQFFGGSTAGDMISMVSGGTLQNATLVAIGLGPYINASVIFQLLGSVIPKIEELQKEGARGRQIINMYTRILAVPLAILQSFVIYSLLKSPEVGIIQELPTLELVNLIASLTAGSIIMMWLGELVAESGLGGGSSLIISVGILAGIPVSLRANIASMDTQGILLLVGAIVLIIVAVIFILEAERQIPIKFARRVRSMGPTVESHIPLKLNQSGVMPVIFSLSLLGFPQLLAQYLTGENIPDQIRDASQWVTTQLENPTTYNILLFVLIVLFSFVYTFVVFNPTNIAENLQKQGAFIPGVRPGRQTVNYLSASAGRLMILGSLFLAAVAVLPSVATQTGLVSSAIVSGTGLLIVVGTLLDIKRQINSMVVTRSYESYL